MSSRNLSQPLAPVFAIAVFIALAGCGRGAPAPIDAPIRYNSTDALRARLEEVAKYGDGGSSLGGIPESIAELTKSDPVKGEKLLADFRRLDTADSKDERKKIAQEMADQLK